MLCMLCNTKGHLGYVNAQPTHLVVLVHNTTRPQSNIYKKRLYERVRRVQPKFNKEEKTMSSSYKELNDLVRQGGKYLNKKYNNFAENLKS